MEMLTPRHPSARMLAYWAYGLAQATSLCLPNSSCSPEHFPTPNHSGRFHRPVCAQRLPPPRYPPTAVATRSPLAPPLPHCHDHPPSRPILCRDTIPRRAPAHPHLTCHGYSITAPAPPRCHQEVTAGAPAPGVCWAVVLDVPPDLTLLGTGVPHQVGHGCQRCHVSSVSNVSDICFKCFIWMLQK
jgi:hypothetical protein